MNPAKNFRLNAWAKPGMAVPEKNSRVSDVKEPQTVGFYFERTS